LHVPACDPVGWFLNALLGWWWADPLAGLVMVPIIGKEGIDGIKASHVALIAGTTDTRTVLPFSINVSRSTSLAWIVLVSSRYRTRFTAGLVIPHCETGLDAFGPCCL
jgi:divalent metal cation (Fe/Co/Zn/Cd) transporter